MDHQEVSRKSQDSKRLPSHSYRIVSTMEIALANMMLWRRVFVVLMFVVLPAWRCHAQTCAVSDDICEGVSVALTSGDCSETFQLCGNRDPNVISQCLNGGVCEHIAASGNNNVCFSDCEPECENKECGEDGCGGFCGSCSEGRGCSNFTCVEGFAAGTCASPFDLDPSIYPSIINITDDRVTIVTTGDTTQAIHLETPSCNTLTASPELIYKFVVPEGRTYGYVYCVF